MLLLHPHGSWSEWTTERNRAIRAVSPLSSPLDGFRRNQNEPCVPHMRTVMISPSPFSQIPGPGKSCGASPNFWQGIAGCSQGESLPQRVSGSRFWLVSVGMGLLPWPASPMPLAPSLPSCWLVFLGLSCFLHHSHACSIPGGCYCMPEQLGALIPSASRKQIKVFWNSTCP